MTPRFTHQPTIKATPELKQVVLTKAYEAWEEQATIRPSDFIRLAACLILAIILILSQTPKAPTNTAPLLTSEQRNHLFHSTLYNDVSIEPTEAVASRHYFKF